MPLTVSVSAFALKRFGASHWRPYQRANQIARLRLGDLERQQRLGPKRVLDLLVRHERRRPAEIAAARRPCPDRRPKSPGSSGTGRRSSRACQPRARVRNAAQRRDEVVLDDDGVGAARLRASPATRCRRTDRSAPAWPDSSAPRRRRRDSDTSRGRWRRRRPAWPVRAAPRLRSGRPELSGRRRVGHDVAPTSGTRRAPPW